MKAHVPEFPAVAAGTCGVVTEDVDHVVETSWEHVHAAELVPDRRENLGEDGSVVAFREAPVGQGPEPAALEVDQLRLGTSVPGRRRVVGILGHKRLAWKDRNSLEVQPGTQGWFEPGQEDAAQERTFSLRVPQLQAGEGRRVVPGQDREPLGRFQDSQEGGAPLQHAVRAEARQRHALEHALVEEALHLPPGHRI